MAGVESSLNYAPVESHGQPRQVSVALVLCAAYCLGRALYGCCITWEFAAPFAWQTATTDDLLRSLHKLFAYGFQAVLEPLLLAILGAVCLLSWRGVRRARALLPVILWCAIAALALESLEQFTTSLLHQIHMLTLGSYFSSELGTPGLVLSMVDGLINYCGLPVLLLALWQSGDGRRLKVIQTVTYVCAAYAGAHTILTTALKWNFWVKFCITGVHGFGFTAYQIDQFENVLYHVLIRIVAPLFLVAAVGALFRFTAMRRFLCIMSGVIIGLTLMYHGWDSSMVILNYTGLLRIRFGNSGEFLTTANWLVDFWGKFVLDCALPACVLIAASLPAGGRTTRS